MKKMKCNPNLFIVFIFSVCLISGISDASEIEGAWAKILLDSVGKAEKETVPVEMDYENDCNDNTPAGMNECRKNSQKIAQDVAVEQGKDKLIYHVSQEAYKNLGYTSEKLVSEISAKVQGNPEFLDAGFVNRDGKLFYRCKIRVNVTGTFSDNIKKELRAKFEQGVSVPDPPVIPPPVTATPPAPQPQPVVSSGTGDKKSVILRLHGSNTIGSKLAPALAEEFLKRMGAAEVSKIPGNQPVECTMDGVFGNKIQSIEIHAHGSSTGFEDMKTGKCDIAMASRKIKSKEADTLSFLGDMTSIVSEHVLALDGIAVIVNKSNPLRSLSIEQLSGIFTGAVADWSEIGGGMQGKINLYARDENSGTFDTFQHFILGKQKLGDAKRFESNAVLSDEVAKDPYGIGFTGLPFIRNSKAVSVSDKGTLSVFPNVFTVATEDYPLSRRLYFYSPPIPQTQHTRDFVEFALSYDGQEIVKQDEIGFVSLNIVPFRANIEPDMPVQNRNVFSKYLETVQNAERLSLNFRFKTGSDELDNKALRDMERMVEYLKKYKDKYDKIVLAGFADSEGDYQKNYSLAMNRAKRVDNELRSRGIFAYNVISVSEEVPVASNDTEDGRAKNRRVEVWTK